MTAILDRSTAERGSTARRGITYSREQTIKLIMRDGRCGRARARLVLFFTEDRTKRGMHGFMTIPQMLLIHPVLERIVPDGATFARVGTAHHALSQLAGPDRFMYHGKTKLFGKLGCFWGPVYIYEAR